MRIAISDDTIGGSGAQIRASVWNAAITAAMLRGDSMLGVRIGVDFDGNVDGPSAGGVICLGIISALNGRKVPGDFAMTGSVLPDGTIGFVGGIMHKIRAAAAEKRIKKVAIPAFSRFELDRDADCYVDLFHLGEKLGIEVRPVASIQEAYRFCHNLPEELEQPLDARDLCSLGSETEKVLVNGFHDVYKRVDESLSKMGDEKLDALRQSYAWPFVNPYSARTLFECGHLAGAFDKIIRCEKALKAYQTVEEATEIWIEWFASNQRKLCSRLDKDNPEAFLDSIRLLCEFQDDFCKSKLGLTPARNEDDEETDESNGDEDGALRDTWSSVVELLDGVPAVSAQLLVLIDSCRSEGFYAHLQRSRLDGVEDIARYLDDPECDKTGFDFFEKYLEKATTGLFRCMCLDAAEEETDDLGSAPEDLIMKAMPSCEFRLPGENVAHLFSNAWKSSDKAFAEDYIEPIADEISARHDDVLSYAMEIDEHVAEFEAGKELLPVIIKVMANGLGTELDYKMAVSISIFSQVELFVEASTLLLKYSSLGLSGNTDECRNTTFLSYVIRIARSQALRSMAECRGAGTPYYSSILFFEKAEASRDSNDADRIHDVLQNYWMANFRAKALLMAFEPPKR